MISSENIELTFFEYYEGLLDKSQEAELMEFLHKNPEYNQDFGTWAQVRLIDEPVSSPSFVPKLIKKPIIWRFINQHGTSIIMTGFGCLLAGLVFWKIMVNPSTDSKNSKGSNQKKVETHILKKEKINPDLKNKQKSLSTQPTIPKKTTPIIIENQQSKEIPIVPLVDSSYSTIQPNDLPVETLTGKEIEAIIIPNQEVGSEISKKEPKPETVPSKKTKNKKVRKISLKPTSDIVPLNSNF